MIGWQQLIRRLAQLMRRTRFDRELETEIAFHIDARADALYEHILPYVTFIMQSIELHILYGKRTFARRAAIDNDCRCRLPKLQPTPYLDAALERWSSRFGAYGRISP